MAKLIETAKGGTKEGARAAEILLDRLTAKPRPTAELVRIEGSVRFFREYRSGST